MKTLVLVVVLLLAWTDSAAAEGAWVLWMTLGSGWAGPDEMTRLDAFTTSAECWRAAAGVFEYQKAVHKEEAEKGGYSKTAARDDALVVWVWLAPFRDNEAPFQRYEWRCWPDSVDPRSK